MTETRTQTLRRYRKLYSESVLKLVDEKKQAPALVAPLAKQKVSAQWQQEFGTGASEDWFPEQAKEN